MYVKKWLALTLAGAVLAMGFSGCDRTIIEHQFHTNTVTDIEHITETVTVESSEIWRKYKQMFVDNGVPNVMLIMQYIPDINYDTYDDVEGFSEAGEEMLICALNGKSTFLFKEYDDEKYEEMDVALEGISEIYDMMQKYMNEERWEKIREGESSILNIMPGSRTTYTPEGTEVTSNYIGIMLAFGSNV